jgi:hypothetical protein
MSYPVTFTNHGRQSGPITNRYLTQEHALNDAPRVRAALGLGPSTDASFTVTGADGRPVAKTLNIAAYEAGARDGSVFTLGGQTADGSNDVGDDDAE